VTDGRGADGVEPSGRDDEEGRDSRALLAAELRRLKEKSGLSYGRLADKTHYSRSSWERFLNGKQLPTAVALEGFAAVMQTDADFLLGLLERATEAEAPAEAKESAGAGPSPAVRDWKPGARGVGLVVVGALVGSLATAVVLGTGMVGGNAATSRPPGPAGASSVGGATLSQQSRPSTQNARPGCSEDTCLRRDPQAMDCQWDATTARETWLRGMHIELRYSAACGSVWGRVESGAVGDSVTIKDKYGLGLSATIRVDRDTYTGMLAVTSEAPPATVTVCGTIPKYHARECSPDGTVEP
jgi:transcriptional regulator with XRE-family HTH domain